MLHQPGVTERLANFVAATRWNDLPQQVAHQAKRSLMNFFAVALAGCRDETVRDRAGTLAAFSGGKQATVIGRRERIDALNAAFLNAAGANVLDFCDTHVPTAIHPTAPLAPALLALAELQRVSGRDLMLAFVLGQEVACRVGLAMSPSHYNKGWHITSTCGVFGAAAGSGKLLGAERAADGVGARHARRRNPPACANAWARRRKASASAMPRATDCGRRCWRRRISPGPPSRSPARRAITMRWARRRTWRRHRRSRRAWEILTTSYKPYPCGFVLHPVLDCVLDWRRDHPSPWSRRSWSPAIRCSAQRADRPTISTSARVAGQRAARGRRRACHRQGRRSNNSPTLA